MKKWFWACVLLPCLAIAQPKQNWPIIQRQGDQLMEGKNIFRFLGLAAPNIQQNESQLLPDFANRFPDEFELRDLLGGLQRMGSRVTRTFSLSVYSPLDKGAPVYISGYRQYNEAAFRCLDQLLALAPQYDVRLIIPFIASQSFGGIRGVDEFSALSNKPAGSFWTDESVMNDFKHFLHFLLNRKNTVTGIRYKDDPAILCWQLGNEFGSYAGDRKLNYAEWTPRIEDWTVKMAAFIKQEDPNHLLMEAGGVSKELMLQNPHIDLISEHLYEYWNKLGGQPWELGPIAQKAWEQCKGKKPLLIDEFGLGSLDNLKALTHVIRTTGISGGLLWSIRGHRRDGGWYYHNEGGTPINSYHVPGFVNGYDYQETQVLDWLRNETYLLYERPLPPVMPPAQTPQLFRLDKGFTWRGATGAAYYELQRAASAKGPFQIIATGLTDAVVYNVAAFEPTNAASFPLVLYVDETAAPQQTYYYRIRGVNTTGASVWSPILTVQY